MGGVSGGVYYKDYARYGMNADGLNCRVEKFRPFKALGFLGFPS
jgi:hypothetical protein